MQQLQTQFLRIVGHTKTEFSRKPIQFVDELRITLTLLPLSNKFKHLQFLREEKQCIMNASSVDKIFEILDKYWNYSDYALLQRLVHKFGDSALKKEMSEYVAALEQFEKRTTIHESNAAASNSRYRI